jgi:hypothetical protein
VSSVGGNAFSHRAATLYPDQMAKSDFPGTLSQIHAIGYQEVELTPVADTLPVDQLRRVVADSGLKAPSGHFEYSDLPGQWTTPNLPASSGS